jgi:hypothetical protein
MGKLHLGEITEMAHRLKTVEEEPVLKLAKELSDVDNPDSQSDVMIMADED